MVSAVIVSRLHSLHASLHSSKQANLPSGPPSAPPATQSQMSQTGRHVVIKESYTQLCSKQNAFDFLFTFFFLLQTPSPTMSDDEADPELLELLRQSLGISKPTYGEVSSETGVWHSYLLRRFSTFAY